MAGNESDVRALCCAGAPVNRPLCPNLLGGGFAAADWRVSRRLKRLPAKGVSGRLLVNGSRDRDGRLFFGDAGSIACG